MNIRLLIFALLITSINTKAQDTLMLKKVTKDTIAHSIEAEIMYYSDSTSKNPSDTTAYRPITAESKLPSNIELCKLGTIDAELYHKKVGQHIVLGILFGPFATLGAVTADPTPNRGKDTYKMSKNKQFFKNPCYRECYAKRARSKNVINTLIGLGVWVGTVFAVYTSS